MNRPILWEKCFFGVSLWGLLFFTALHALPVSAQDFGFGVVPSDRYRAAIAICNDGNYVEALDVYQSELRGSVKFGENRWIDAICYQTMIGECYFQMGNYTAAFENYTGALQYYLAYYDWMNYIDFDLTTSGGASNIPRVPTPWGISSRVNPMIRFPKSYKIRISTPAIGMRTDSSGQARPDVGEKVEYHSVYAVDIVESMALAIRRRGEILGPLGKFDALNDQLVDILQQRPCLPNHWSGAWVDLCYGLALSVQERDEEAHPFLERSLLIMGTTDHPLTATGFLGLGQIAVRTGDFQAAYIRFYEASIAAYYYGNSIVLEETFRMMAMCQKMIDRRQPWALAIPALAWAEKERFTTLQFSLNILNAENALLVRDFPTALNFLNRAWACSNRRALREGRLCGYWNYLSAFLNYATGKVAEGDLKLEAAMNNMKNASLWIHQIRTLEFFYRNGQIKTTGPITPRTAMDLYELLLRDPTAQDWNMNPLEALTVVSIPHSDSFERWFFLAIDREDAEKAFEIAELTRRHRFQSTLPFGSRLISLRLLFEAPEEFLPPEFLLDKKDLIVEMPGFAELSAQSKELRNQIADLPRTFTTTQQVKEAKSLYDQWTDVSRTQEALLKLIAMSRVKSPNVFPPFKTFSQFRQELPEGTVVLMFFKSHGEYFGFLIGKSQFEFWRIPNSARLQGNITKYLRAIGMIDANRILTLKDLARDDWKTMGQQIFAETLAGERQTNFKELVIIPDGFLWYLPFETLNMETQPGQLRPLIGIVGPDKSEPTIRYAPTAALALPAKTTSHLGATTNVYLGRLFPTNKPEVAQAAFERMQTELQNLSPLTPEQVTLNPTLMAKSMRQLLVLDDILATRVGPYDWMPLPAAKGLAAEATLRNWMFLPWGAPKLLMFPGFHTHAEDAFRKEGGDGEEIFFALTALQSCGADTVLISRWRPGGRTSYDLMTQFLKNLNKFPADMAWRKSVFQVAGQTIIPEEEPRLKFTADEKDKLPKANHPFFWGAFLLCDRGEIPVSEEKPARDDMPDVEIMNLDDIDLPSINMTPE